ncbi:MAG: glycosyltransferase [Candidatus Accumulibacter phosphatis]|nr:glycosyltransferase [Candidatus Accumulibacter phosphatis]
MREAVIAFIIRVSEIAVTLGVDLFWSESLSTTHAEAPASHQTKRSSGCVSVVVPVYRSRESLPLLVEGVETEFRRIGRAYEIVLVDDCSPDDTWEVMKRLKEGRPHLKIAHLLRNSGQHNAILCGFSLATGDVVITMDDDLQNPPNEIGKLISAIERGYDLAIASYDCKKHSRFRNLGGALVDGLQRRIFGIPHDFQLTSFRAVRRVVVDNVVQMGGVYPYVTSMLLSHTSKYVNVPTLHAARQFGSSNYNLKRSLFLALNLLLTYSAYPLYLIALLCSLAFLFSATLGAWTLWRALFQGIAVPGWASTMVVMSSFNALILLALVIQGIYLSRVSRQISRSHVSFTIGELHE